jgi:hypothetical protein
MELLQGGIGWKGRDVPLLPHKYALKWYIADSQSLPLLIDTRRYRSLRVKIMEKVTSRMGMEYPGC